LIIALSDADCKETSTLVDAFFLACLLTPGSSERVNEEEAISQASGSGALSLRASQDSLCYSKILSLATTLANTAAIWRNRKGSPYAGRDGSYWPSAPLQIASL